MATRPTPAAAATAPNYTGPFIIVSGLFLMFGFLTNMNSNLSAKLEDIFHLNHAGSNLITTSWFFAYLVFSVPAGRLIELVGYKRTMVISLFAMVLGALLFVPAANTASFPFFLAASFVLATGVTGLQTSVNLYASIMGPEHSAPARLSLAQAFNSAGNILAPIVVGAFILSGSTKGMDRAAAAHTVQGPYIAVAIVLLLSGFAVIVLHLPAINLACDFRPARHGVPKLERSIWAHKHTVLALVGIFMYVGLEVSLFANAIRFFQSQGVDDMHKASVLAAFYPLTMMIGRFAGTFAMKYIEAERLLASVGVLGVALMVTGMFVTGQTAVWCFILCGLANSIMYPTIFTLGIAELGPLTSEGAGVLTLGGVGGAILPPLFGYLADKMGYQHAFLVPIVGYVFIIYFALSGYKPEREAAT